MADKLEKVLDKTDIKHVLVTQLGDLHDAQALADQRGKKHVKKMVPAIRPKRRWFPRRPEKRLH